MRTRGFWDLFGADYRRNCLAWQHSEHNPVLPAGGADWRSRWTANPDLLELDGRTLLYYRGNGRLEGDGGQAYHDRIGVAELESVGEQGRLTLRPLHDDRPIVDVGTPGSFDARDVLDPATVEFDGRILLYYSAIGDAGTPDSIGLAVSADGVRFEKLGRVVEGRCPEVVTLDGRLELFVQVPYDAGQGSGFALQRWVSGDGVAFERLAERPVLTATRGSWDGRSVCTARIWRERPGGDFFMLYAGSPHAVDEPDYFGLARSDDLEHWERHPGNPIFGRGPVGAEDGGAIWFPALLADPATDPERYTLLYEGSRGRYAWDLSSQLCAATIARRQI